MFVHLCSCLRTSPHLQCTMGGTVGRENATVVPFDTGRARNVSPSHAEIFLPSAVLSVVIGFSTYACVLPYNVYIALYQTKT